MSTVELFSGTKSFSKVASLRGHSTRTIDNDSRLEPDEIGDMETYTWSGGHIDMLWASPPCTTFSVASIGHYWTDGKPKNEKALHGIMLLEKTIEFIKVNNPTHWFIENPRGMMRKVIDPIFQRYGISDYIRHTVSYCQYGHKIMKPTDIWTNCHSWTPRPICKPGAPCHERAGRGAKTGVQGIYNLEWEKARGGSATARGQIPSQLFEEIFDDVDLSTGTH